LGEFFFFDEKVENLLRNFEFSLVFLWKFLYNEFNNSAFVW